MPRPTQPQAGSRQLFLCVLPGAAPGRFRIERDSSLLDSDVAESRLVPLLQRAIEEAIVQDSRDFVAVHSGVVVYDGVAVLLPGQSQSGKTTLVRELIGRGAEYSSDEYAMIDALGRVHPWPRALMIRDANSDQRPVSAADLGAVVRERPARAGLILFLQYGGEADFRVRPIGQSDTLFGLLRNTPHSLAESPQILGHLTAAIRTTEAYEGVRGEAVHAADGLLRMIQRL